MRNPEAFFAHLKKVGFDPKTIVDVGVAKGTPDIYNAFPDAYYVLIDAVPEYEKSMQQILQTVHGEYHLIAVSDEPGKMPMMIREPYFISSLQFDQENIKDKSAVRMVEVKTIDQILATRDRDTPIMLKTDCQGHDLNVIRGASASLDDIEVIICELPIYGPWGGGYELLDYVVGLDEMGYRFYDVWGWLYRPGDERLQHLDLVFVKTNGLLRQNPLFTQGPANVNYFAKKFGLDAK